MSTRLITTDMRVHTARQFKESITEVANSVYYVFVSNHTPYDDESVTPTPVDSINNSFYEPYQKMVFGKRVLDQDVALMIERHDWSRGAVFEQYDHTMDLTGQPFYAVVNAYSAYYVFKCLDNNDGAASIVQPNYFETGADDEYYRTYDGYVWKYMFQVPKSTFDKFATEKYLPVVVDSAVTANAVAGAIDVIDVSYRGSNYDTFLSGIFTAGDIAVGGNNQVFGLANTANDNNNFYNDSVIYITSGTGAGQIRRIADYIVAASSKRVVVDSEFFPRPDSTSTYEITPGVTIVGDGAGAIARAVVNTASANSITRIEVIDRGELYTYATAIVTGNTSGVSNTAVILPIIGPKGGHGSDVYSELGARYLGVSVSFANNEANTIPDVNDYRQIGLLKDPKWNMIEVHAANTTQVTGSFVAGEVVTQNVAGSVATGILDSAASTVFLIANAVGIFTTGLPIVGATSNAHANVDSIYVGGVTTSFLTFDQRYRLNTSGVNGSFQEDEKVYQVEMASANADFHQWDGNYAYVTNMQGSFVAGENLIGELSGASANVGDIVYPDLARNSGEVLYIENILPITRSNNQSETVKLILKF